MLKNRINLCLIGINIIFLQYYALQLLIFTDEFALQNIGFFNIGDEANGMYGLGIPDDLKLFESLDISLDATKRIKMSTL